MECEHPCTFRAPLRTPKKARSSAGGGRADARAGFRTGAVEPFVKARRLLDIDPDSTERIPTGISEFDRVIGGGFVPSMTCVLGAPPGTGKSSLATHLCDAMSARGPVLYVSGEESEGQILARAHRLGVSGENVFVVNETDLNVVLGHVEDVDPCFLVVDSLQTMASADVSGVIGSVSQSREAASALNMICKSRGIVGLFINQVNKDGELAGAESSKHIVDCVLYLESDKDSPLKFLRADKNRFGDVDEVGVFQHTETAFEGVGDPSGVFLDGVRGPRAGAAPSFQSEGVRQFCVEVQALVARAATQVVKRQIGGVQYDRGQRVLGVLSAFCGLDLSQYDVFIGVKSGVRVRDPLCDLGIAAAVLSAKMGPDRFSSNVNRAYIGEVSLTGDVEGSLLVESKVANALRLGFDEIVVPRQALPKLSRTHRGDSRVRAISSIRELRAVVEEGVRRG